MAQTRADVQPEASANRLARESSPYLLQHAHNPVDWYPWGPEAFEAARRRDVPIFLSIGYSTCYWCHVMERESFENVETARQMNEQFVCVKVDREERPDVDDVYMAAVQAMTRSGGWPMSVFLEPRSLKPFWCGTYFPPKDAYGRPGFPTVLAGITRAWTTQRDEINQQAEQLAEAVTEQLAGERPAAALSEDQIARAVGSLLKSHDPALGGFGPAPKFPQPCYLRFLLSFRPHAGDEDTRRAVDAAIRVTLDHMACGGMFDQAGGGFHRYSTDEKWLVPHFEKMLYDNGQLAGVYADAARVYSEPFYALTARRICEYVLREMTSPVGAFYSAQDAEVNHREGQNYLWTLAELERVLGKDDAAWAAKVYGLDGGPNFRDPHHPQEPMSSVLFLAQPPGLTARLLGMEPEEFARRLDRVNALLYASRSARQQPARDEKLLAAWNGLMIAGLATSGASLGEPRFIASAKAAADFILASMREPPGGAHPGGLLRCGGLVGGAVRAGIPAFLEDYACVIHGLIELHRAGCDARGAYLSEAIRLAAEAESRFGSDDGAFFDTLADQTDLFVRTRSEYDGAIPSASSIMLNDLLDLFEITGDRRHAVRAGRLLMRLSAFVDAAPVGGINSARGLLRFLVMDPAVRAEVMPGLLEAGGSEPRAEALDAHQPVAVFAAVDEVNLAEGEASGVVLKLTIEEGYHVNAAEPGIDGLVGLRVTIINGSGVTAYADYPAGDVYRPAWSGPGSPELRVYKGEVSIPVLLERTGTWSGTPLLAVTYQACTDDACLAPQAVELDVAINRK